MKLNEVLNDLLGGGKITHSDFTKSQHLEIVSGVLKRFETVTDAVPYAFTDSDLTRGDWAAV